MPIISKDIPLAELTLRKYENPAGLQKRDLVRKLCLSLGLLQPGDSRDVVVDIFQSLIDAKHPVTSDQIQEAVIANRKKHNVQLLGIAPSNIRRQIKRLRDIFLIEKIGNEYRITENEKLLSVFEERVEKYYLRSITTRVKEYLKEIEKH